MKTLQMLFLNYQEGKETALWVSFAVTLLIINFRRRPDTRLCTDRIDQCIDHWNLQLSALVNAYLEYRLHETKDQQAQ